MLGSLGQPLVGLLGRPGWKWGFVALGKQRECELNSNNVLPSLWSPGRLSRLWQMIQVCYSSLC